MLRTLITRMNGVSPPSREALERALEQGSAKLIQLEAAVQRICGDGPAGGTPSFREPECETIRKEVSELRLTLSQLRENLPQTGRFALISGFVLEQPPLPGHPPNMLE